MTLKELEVKLNNLTETVDKLAGIVENLLTIKEPAKPEPVTPDVHPASPYPIPSEYREAVDAILNKHFGIQLEPMSDSPQFTFTIIVPDRYSTLTPSQKEMHVADIRPKVISYADGLNGVKLWVEKVLSSFNQDMRVQIAQDRNS